MCQQKFHLIGQDLPPLQIDILCMCGAERDGEQLHTRLLRGPARLVIIAALAGGNDINPTVLTALAQRVNVISGKKEVWKLLAAVETQALVAPEQGFIT